MRLTRTMRDFLFAFKVRKTQFIFSLLGKNLKFEFHLASLDVFHQHLVTALALFFLKQLFA